MGKEADPTKLDDQFCSRLFKQFAAHHAAVVTHPASRTAAPTTGRRWVFAANISMIEGASDMTELLERDGGGDQEVVRARFCCHRDRFGQVLRKAGPHV